MKKQNFELIWQLAKTDFKIRYNGSVLGYLWALLKPLLIFLILNFVFSNVFGRNIPNYSINLLTGIILWSYFAEATTVGMTALLSKANLITKVKISKTAIVFASTINSTISFLINLVILVIFFVGYHVFPSVLGVLLFFAFLIILYALVLGLTFLTAPLFVKYRDLNQIWEVLMTLGFYASPIIYPLSLIPANYQNFLWINPMSYIINYSKLALIENQFIPYGQFAILLGVVLIILFTGITVFSKMKSRVAENI